MPLAEEQGEECIKLFKGGKSHSQISKLLNVSVSSIWTYLHKVKKLPKRGRTTLKADKDYFKVINTAQKAYWLGFLYADGCVQQDCVTLNLAPLDEHHVELFGKHVKREGTIRRYCLKDGTHKSSIISISGQIFRGHLIDKGCTMRKTFTLKFPSNDIVPDKLISHFIRGYFDGDGSVWQNNFLSKHGTPSTSVESSITSSDSFIEGLQKRLKKAKIHSTIKRHKTHGISILRITRCKDLIEFRAFLYRNAKVFLERKKDKFYSVPIGKAFPAKVIHRRLILEVLTKFNRKMSAKEIMTKKKTIPYQRLNSGLNYLIKAKKVKRTPFLSWDSSRDQYARTYYYELA